MLQRASEAGLSPDRLVLTEHERVEDVDGLQAAMKILAEQGITLAIDDLGDGRSSLRLWVQLKPQIVKLDKYFVRGLHRDRRKLEVGRSVPLLRFSSESGFRSGDGRPGPALRPWSGPTTRSRKGGSRSQGAPSTRHR